MGGRQVKRFLVTMKVRDNNADALLARVLAGVPDATWISIRTDCNTLAQYQKPAAKVVDEATKDVA